MTIPNLLSLLRLALVPVFALVYFSCAPNAHLWSAVLYLAAFVTDVADGWIARRFSQITRLGRILDPMADKLMTFIVILCLTADGVIPVWAVVIFFCKEMAMAIGGYLMYRARGDVISSNWLGKSATGVFFVVCAALVLFPAIPRPWAVRMISAALVLTVAAFFSYLYQFVKGLEKRKSH